MKGCFIFSVVLLLVSSFKLMAGGNQILDFKQIMDENFFSTINDGKNDGAVYFCKTE